jgi:hypothetical protein
MGNLLERVAWNKKSTKLNTKIRIEMVTLTYPKMPPTIHYRSYQLSHPLGPNCLFAHKHEMLEDRSKEILSQCPCDINHLLATIAAHYHGVFPAFINVLILCRPHSAHRHYYTLSVVSSEIVRCAPGRKLL